MLTSLIAFYQMILFFLITDPCILTFMWYYLHDLVVVCLFLIVFRLPLWNNICLKHMVNVVKYGNCEQKVASSNRQYLGGSFFFLRERWREAGGE